jgi:DNA-binding MarR family transcriptional regulator
MAIGEALHGLAGVAVRHGGREISLTAASTLATLERAGPRRITELALSEGVTQPSMTALVTGLERSGLVERRQDLGDRRAVLVALTSAGNTYLSSRQRSGAEVFARLVNQLAPEEVAALRAAAPALERMRELDDHREPGGDQNERRSRRVLARAGEERR